MARISLTELLVSIITENQQTLTAFREVEAAKERMLASGDKAGLQTTLDKLGSSAVTVNKQLDPLVRTSRSLQEEMRDLGTFVKAGLIPLTDAARRYRELESAEKALLTAQTRGSAAWKETVSRMKEAGTEAKRLEGFLRESNQRFDAPELVRYVQRLRDVTTAEKAGLVTRSQAIADLKRQEAAIQSLIGVYNRDEQAQRSLIKVLGDTGTAIRKLEQEGDRLEAAFRADYLKVYEGELRAVDQRVSQIGFEAAAREVEDLTRDLKAQAGELARNGTEFNNLQRVLGSAAQQQEKYQRAAEAAARANDAAQIRTYGVELKDAEARIQSATVALGRLDAQQRAIRYDASGVRAYREENERLGTSLGGIGGDLNELQSRLTAHLGTLTKGTAAYRDTETMLERVGRATQTLATQQEKAAAAYRAADLSRFTQELRDVETAQKAGLISAEAALRATERIQTEFREYAASLGVTSRELKSYGDEQERAGKSALDLAAAAEKAQKAFDVRALSGFRGELEQVVRSLQSGDADFDRLAGSVQDLQARMREYGSSLGGAGREQDSLNRIIEASERTLEALAGSAEKAQRAFDGGEVRDFADDLEQVERAGSDLDDNFERIAGSLGDLERELADTGREADLTAKDLGSLAGIERELETAALRLGQANERAMASFKGDQLRGFKTELDQIVTAQKNGTLSFEQAGQALSQLQGRMREYGSSTELTARQQDTLQRAMGSTETAARNLERSFVSENVRRYETQLRGLQDVFEQTRNIDAFREGINRLNTEIETSRGATERGSAAYLAYTKSLDRTATSLAAAEGRTRTFSTSGAIAAGVGDQLTTIFYAMGPAGEGMATAMFAATGGMQAAAGGARILNIALATGLVGALIAVGVAAVGIVKGMFALDTGLTDVAKTTGFTNDELNQLAEELKTISINTGTPITKLTGLASVAGSLGVTGVKNVALFTDTLNKLAIATDIVGDEGAEQLAKFINVTKEANQSVGESANVVGNVIVRLGNDLAATEAPILAMAQRLGGLATTAGLSQTEILALSGTYVSLGFTAEGASTSVIKIINTIAQAGKTGGPALDALARGAGLTREEFAKLAKENPAAAFQAYIQGLREAKDAGENITPVIKEITKDNTAMMDAITRVVGGVDTLNLAFNSAADEAQNLTAMNNELDTRLASLAGITSLIQQAFAQYGTTIALALIPHLKTALTGVLDFARGLAGLNTDVDGNTSAMARFGQAMGIMAKASFAAFSLIANVIKATFTVLTGFFNLLGDAVGQIQKLLGIKPVADTVESSFDKIGTAARTAQQNVGTASDKKSLVGALDALAGSLKGEAKTQARALAQEIQDTGVSFDTAAEKVKNFARAIEIQAELKRIQTELARLEAEKTEIKIEATNNVDSVVAEAESYLKDMLGVDTPVKISFVEEGGEKVAKVTEGLGDASALTATQQRELERVLLVISRAYRENSYAADTATNALDSQGDRTEALRAESAALTSELNSLGVSNQNTAQKSRELGTALQEYNRAFDQSINVTKMSEQNLVTYIERLQAVKAAYPQLTGNIDKWLATAKSQLQQLRDNKKANEDNTGAVEDAAAAEDAAAEAAQRREDALEQVNEATVLLGRGTGVTSDALFQMAQDLGEATQQSGDLGVKARELQTQLVLQAAAMDKAAEAQERAAEAAERYQERQDQVASAQALLQKGLSASSDELFQMAIELGDAASQSGELGEQARALQLRLVDQAVAVDKAAQAQIRAEEAAGRYAERQEQVASAQALLQKGYSASSDELFQMAQDLGDAANQTGLLGEQARQLQARLIEQAVAIDKQAEAQERAAAASEKYHTNLGAVRDAQDLLGSGVAATSDQLFSMAQSLGEAAQGQGELGEQARQLQLALVQQAVAFDQNAKAAEAAAEASRRYGENQQSVADAQKLLGQGAGATSDQLFQMAMDLSEAAKGTGELGEQARELQTKLVLQAAEMDRAGKAAESAAKANEAWTDVLQQAELGTREQAEGLRQLATELINAAGGYAKLTPAQKATVDGMQATAEAIDRARLAIDGFRIASSIFGEVANLIRNSGTSQALEELTQKRDDFLEGGEYNPEALRQLNDDIDALSERLAAEELWAGLFDGLTTGLDTFIAAWEAGGDVINAVIQGLGAAVSSLAEEMGGANEAAVSAMDATGQWISATAAGFATGGPIGGIVGFLGGMFNFVVSGFQAMAKEADQFKEATARVGAEMAQTFVKRDFWGQEYFDEEAYNAYIAELERVQEEQEAARKRAEELHAEWLEGQRQLQENRQELAAYTDEIRKNTAAAQDGARSAQLDYAKASGAKGPEILIAETILALQEESKKLGEEWNRINADQEKWIADYMAANPGATRAQALAQAEAIFGPQREAIVQEMGYNSATILAEAGKQAKELGLSQEEFYTAVLQGNTKLLGDMTEGQRQALLQVIQVLRDMGIELPAGLEAAFANVDAANAEAAQAGVAATEQATKDRIAAIEQEKTDLAAAWETRRRYLDEKIMSTSGAEQQMWKDMKAAESAAFREASQAKSDEIAAIEAETTQVDVGALEKRRETLKAEYERQMQEISTALETATGAERDALLARQDALTDAYMTSDKALLDAINEEGDGKGSALEASTAKLVQSIQEDIAATNSAWAARSAELKNLIANSTGEAKAMYEQMYAEESAAYQQEMGNLQTALVDANQSLLDAQDASADDFVAAQEEVGRREQEALGGVFEILRQILGEDAELIISMIQTTYDKRRAAYLAEGQATAEAASTANQSELDALGGVYETLRALLGEDAEVIISMIQGTYDKRQAAYQQGGDAAANAAAASAESERQSIANVNQILRDMFGPEAQGIIDQILALYDKRAAAYNSGGAGASAAATAAGESERQSIANINELLRQIFGPEAQGIIDQILALYEKKEQAYASGGEATAGAASEAADTETAAIDDGTTQTGQALEERQATLESLLQRQDLTPALRAAGERVDAALRDGGNLTEQEIQANRDKITAAINERGTKIQALVEQGIPLDEAVRRVDEELAATWNATSDLITGEVEGNTEKVGGSIEERTARLKELTDQGLPLAEAQRQVDSEFGAALTQGTQLITGSLLQGVAGVAQGFLARQGAISSAQVKDAALSAAERLNQDQISAVFGEFGPRVSAGLLSGATSVVAGFAARQGAIAAAQGKEAALESAERLNQARLGSTFSEFGPVIGSALQGGTSQAVDAIRAREQLLGGTFSTTFSSLSGIYGAGTKDLTAAVTGTGATLAGSVSSTFAGVGSVFSQGAGIVEGAVDSGFGRIQNEYQTATGGLVSSIQGTYQSVGNAQTSGSSAYVQKIQQAAAAEQNQYQAASSALLQKIAGAKGAEREKLVAEYQRLQAEHEAKSRAYQSEIMDAARQEVSGIDGAARVVVGALNGFGIDTVQGTKEAYGKFSSQQRQEAAEAAREAANAGRDVDGAISAAQRLISGGFVDFGSKTSTDARTAYERFIREQEMKARAAAAEARDGSDDIRAAIIGGGTLIGGGFTSALSSVLPKLNSYFSGQSNAFTSKSGDLVTGINNSRFKLSTALGDYNDLIKNFKFAPLPTPPSPPTAVRSSGYDPEFGGSFSYTAPAPDLAVLAADATGMIRPSLPDFRTARGDVVAYAAATDDLLRLYGRSGSLRLNSVQETAFTVNLTFASLTTALSGPFALLERSAALFHSGARISYEAALIMREAANNSGGAKRTTMLELTTRPGKAR